MVYIGRDGVVRASQPWGIERIKGIIRGFFNFLLMFFRTMLDFNLGAGSGAGNQRGSGSGGGGDGPPRPPRRIGRTMTLSDCTVPGGG
ncbi:Selenoprotein G [Anopheles darlingi]|uniref:Selenoprotein G n=1 Tax=Anopheles darlingi TaxID=43151 RepID=W5JW72_ANODA|nr:glycine-rich selenoprotein-like [Anopheles darlingi]ETN67798.1 Selenoprotein G [Anopheles darlingi]